MEMSVPSVQGVRADSSYTWHILSIEIFLLTIRLHKDKKPGLITSEYTDENAFFLPAKTFSRPPLVFPRLREKETRRDKISIICFFSPIILISCGRSFLEVFGVWIIGVSPLLLKTKVDRFISCKNK